MTTINSESSSQTQTFSYLQSNRPKYDLGSSSFTSARPVKQGKNGCIPEQFPMITGSDLSGSGFDTSSHSSERKFSSTDSSGGSFQTEVAFRPEVLKAKLIYLKKFASHKKTDLDHGDHIKLMEIISMSVAIAGTNQYDEFIDIVISVFGGIKTVERGTVADFFVGCSNKSPYSGVHGCSAECAGNLPRKGYKAEDFCSTHVAMYDGSLKLNYSPATKSDILLIHSTFNSFKLVPEEIDELRNKGIYKAILSYYTNGEYTSTGEIINIIELCPRMIKKQKVDSGTPKYQGQIKSSKGRHNKDTDTDRDTDRNRDIRGKFAESDDNSSGFGILLFIIVFIIIIILIYAVIAARSDHSWYNKSHRSSISAY